MRCETATSATAQGGGRWDLDVIFPGGSSSGPFREFLAALQRDIEALGRRIDEMEAPARAGDFRPWETLIDLAQDVQARLREAGSFLSCLTAQDVEDEQARILEGRVHQMMAALQAADARLGCKLAAIPPATWQAMMEAPHFAPVAFALRERRELASEEMPPEQETLAASLAVDGYHAWGSLYDLVVGRMRIPFEENGRTVGLSVPQAANLLQSPTRAMREALAPRWEEAWAGQADVLATILNHLAGFRLNLYRHRGWNDVLQEPLRRNRLSRPILEAMWEGVERAGAKLEAYLQRKARLLGVDALEWHDVGARLGTTVQRYSFDEAAAMVCERFGGFSPDMERLARRALSDRWIEWENRPGKAAGGFCTAFPLARQSRVFMTFSGVPANVETLAHELGHAFHQAMVETLPAFAQRYPMSLAETASTFAELVVSESTIRLAGSGREQVSLLDHRLSRATDFLMNIRARFLFEEAFYTARTKGPLSVAELDEMMRRAQERAYRGALASYHPHFWASKLHFYLTAVPFYNFPYTFGFLFSHGVYARARSEGTRFAGTYVALLRDSGQMAVEDLARRHLGADLTRAAFWDEACQSALAGLEGFLRLTDRGMPQDGTPEEERTP